LLATLEIVATVMASPYTLEIIHKCLLECCPTFNGFWSKSLELGYRNRLECHWKKDSLDIIAIPCEFDGVGVDTEPLLWFSLAVTLLEVSWFELVWEGNNF
jgi:hypothetical protein